MAEQFDVFLSYSRNDLEAARLMLAAIWGGMSASRRGGWASGTCGAPAAGAPMVTRSLRRIEGEAQGAFADLQGRPGGVVSRG